MTYLVQSVSKNSAILSRKFLIPTPGPSFRDLWAPKKKGSRPMGGGGVKFGLLGKRQGDLTHLDPKGSVNWVSKVQ